VAVTFNVDAVTAGFLAEPRSHCRDLAISAAPPAHVSNFQLVCSASFIRRMRS
jgi:hypothetical protein